MSRFNKFWEIEEELMPWLLTCRDQGIPVENEMIRERALMVAERLGMRGGGHPHQFTGGRPWLKTFKDRFGITNGVATRLGFTATDLAREKAYGRFPLDEPFLVELPDEDGNVLDPWDISYSECDFMEFELYGPYIIFKPEVTTGHSPSDDPNASSSSSPPGAYDAPDPQRIHLPSSPSWPDTVSFRSETNDSDLSSQVVAASPSIMVGAASSPHFDIPIDSFAAPNLLASTSQPGDTTAVVCSPSLSIMSSPTFSLPATPPSLPLPFDPSVAQPTTDWACGEVALQRDFDDRLPMHPCYAMSSDTAIEENPGFTLIHSRAILTDGWLKDYAPSQAFKQVTTYEPYMGSHIDGSTDPGTMWFVQSHC